MKIVLLVRHTSGSSVWKRKLVSGEADVSREPAGSCVCVPVFVAQ